MNFEIEELYIFKNMMKYLLILICKKKTADKQTTIITKQSKLIVKQLFKYRTSM